MSNEKLAWQPHYIITPALARRLMEIEAARRKRAYRLSAEYWQCRRNANRDHSRLLHHHPAS